MNRTTVTKKKGKTPEGKGCAQEKCPEILTVPGRGTIIRGKKGSVHLKRGESENGNKRDRGDHLLGDQVGVEKWEKHGKGKSTTAPNLKKKQKTWYQAEELKGKTQRKKEQGGKL